MFILPYKELVLLTLCEQDCEKVVCPGQFSCFYEIKHGLFFLLYTARIRSIDRLWSAVSVKMKDSK